MKSSLLKINHFIPLLTDTLPYEVPFFFSNRGIYSSLKEAYDVYFNAQNVKKAKGQKGNDVDKSLIEFFTGEYFDKNKNLQSLVKKACLSKPSTSIPYEYQIKNADRGYRNISLIHPVAQIGICDIYKKYKDVILFYCGRSPYSIRYPSKVASRLIAKDVSLEDHEIEDSEVVFSPKSPSSYFVLKEYKLLHEFYDSSEMLDLEKKFLQWRLIDVKRCFESIYTHSISWAVKDREYTKKNLYVFFNSKPKPFEYEFDKLMQFSNYNETHGIAIGAEASRLFSEIILQKIDLNIQKQIKGVSVNRRMPIKGQDFEIKRYMDNFFIFTNDKSLSERIQKICEHELQNYKLFINESKTAFLERPFIMPISSAKQNIRILLDEYLNDFGLQKNKSNSSKFRHRPKYRSSLQVINGIRGIVCDHKLSFYDISNFTLAILRTHIYEEIFPCIKEWKKEVDEMPISRIRNYLKSIIDIVFYVFYLSPRSHTASIIFKTGRIILDMLEVVNKTDLTEEIKQEFSFHILKFCEKISYSQDESIVEFLDLILFLNYLGDDFRVKEGRLKRIFKMKDKNNEDSTLSYFEIVVLLSHIKEEPSCDEVREIIFESCCKKLSSENGLKETENFLLFFDLIKCPYLGESKKKEILGYVNIESDKLEAISFINKKRWFFDWGEQESLDLRGVLEIKEAHLSY